MKKRYIVLSVIFVQIIALLITSVLAIQSGLTMYSLEEGEKERINQNRNVEIYRTPISGSIACFDISNEGKIALGHATSFTNNHAQISVYDEDFNFLYGLRFKVSGSYYVSWSGEDLLVYTVRNDIAAVYNENGSCLEMMKCDTSAENYSYVRKVLAAKKRTSGGKTYKLKNNFGLLNLVASSYSCLVQIDTFGNEEVIYNTSGEYLTRLILKVLLINAFVAFGILAMVKRLERIEKGRGDTNL